MESVYLAGRKDPNDGLFSCPDQHAIFYTQTEAAGLYENGMSRRIYIYKTVEEYQEQKLRDEKYMARAILVKAGYSESEAQKLVP